MENLIDPQNKGLIQLMDKAKSDPQFFHDLIWNTESVLLNLDFLTKKEKAAILSIDPENLIFGLATNFTQENPGSECGGTCGASCGASCGATCGGSCGGSCAGSCGGTCALSSLLTPEGNETIDPADVYSAETAHKIQDSIDQNKQFSRIKRN